jgi:hypothetical protein
LHARHHSSIPVLSPQISHRTAPIGPTQGCAVPPILPRVRSAQARALYCQTRGKIGSPAPRFAAQASLTRPDRRGAPAPSSKQKEGTTITLQGHIEELRAELRGCITRRERAAIEVELTAAITALKERDGAAEAHHQG